MLRFFKPSGLGSQIGLSLLAVILAGGIAKIEADPVCTTTITLPGGSGTVLNSALGPGVCVESGDKLYGDFNFGNLPASGTAVQFTFVTSGGVERFSIQFSAPFQPGTTYNDSYEVAVIQGGGFPNNNFITQLRADIPQTIGGPTTLVQTLSTVPNSGSINLSKTDNVVSGSSVANFLVGQAVEDLTVSSTLTLAPGFSDASAQLNTIFQSQPIVPTPEPASMETLLMALTGLAFGYVKLKSRRG